jgi:hypothetical protein
MNQKTPANKALKRIGQKAASRLAFRYAIKMKIYSQARKT